MATVAARRSARTAKPVDRAARYCETVIPSTREKQPVGSKRGAAAFVDVDFGSDSEADGASEDEGGWSELAEDDEDDEELTEEEEDELQQRRASQRKGGPGPSSAAAAAGQPRRFADGRCAQQGTVELRCRVPFVYA